MVGTWWIVDFLRSALHDVTNKSSVIGYHVLSTQFIIRILMEKIRIITYSRTICSDCPKLINCVYLQACFIRISLHRHHLPLELTRLLRSHSPPSFPIYTCIQGPIQGPVCLELYLFSSLPQPCLRKTSRL